MPCRYVVKSNNSIQTTNSFRGSKCEMRLRFIDNWGYLNITGFFNGRDDLVLMSQEGVSNRRDDHIRLLYGIHETRMIVKISLSSFSQS